MNNAEYWQKRAEELEKIEYRKSAAYLENLQTEYRKAIKAVEKDINQWYARFADNNKVSIQQAYRMLNKRELEELKWDVEEYIKRGRA